VVLAALSGLSYGGTGNMNIVLIGYRGTGKSTVGRIVAERLSMRTVSMDSEIVKKAALTINQIVEQYGWNTFRDLETELTKELTVQNGLVIDTGGGVIERQENVDNLQRNSVVFWLKASVDILAVRIRRDTSRPALTSGKTFVEEIAEVLERREPLYRSAAHHEIETDNKTPGQIADSIITLWDQKAVFETRPFETAINPASIPVNPPGTVSSRLPC
jgi:shikimate kinase